MHKGVSRRELVKRFSHLGFGGPYPGRKHFFMTYAGLRVRIPNPHGGGVSAPLLAEILRQAGISREEFWNADI